jgi:hypothetical protein
VRLRANRVSPVARIVLVLVLVRVLVFPPFYLPASKIDNAHENEDEHD